jgi:hypothetical protein
MKKFIAGLLIFIACNHDLAFGQDNRVEPGFTVINSAAGTPSGYQKLGVYSESNGGYVQVSYRKYVGLSFQSFDSSFTYTGETRIDLKGLPFAGVNISLEVTGGRYYWFFTTENKVFNRTTLWAQRIDVAGRKFSGKPVALINVNNVVGRFKISTSADKSKMLFIYRMPPKVKIDILNKVEIGFIVIDSALNYITNRLQKMPLSEEKMDNKEYFVDNSGNAYFLSKIFDNKGGPGYHYDLFSLKAGSDSLDYFIIPMQRYYYSFPFLTEQSNGDIIFGGFYSLDEETETNDGVFIKVLRSDSFADFGSGYFAFSPGLLKQFNKEYDGENTGDKTITGGKAQSVVLRNVSLNSTGGIDILGEVFKGGLTSFSKLYFGEIFYMRTEADGTLKWMKIIPKRQVCVNNPFTGSFGYFNGGENLYLLYYDNPKNIPLEPGAIPAIYDYRKDPAFVCTMIDSAGNVSSSVIADHNNDSTHILYNLNSFQPLGKNKIAGNEAEKKHRSVVVICKK